MSFLKDPIDYEGLEQELHEALRADELYRLQNDAKIRAVEQAVPTYEDFREMVNGAHLKSLDRKDMTPKLGVKWNSIASDKSSLCDDKSLRTYRQKAKQIPSDRAPRNIQEFQHMWKTSDSYREKFELLNISRLALQSVIFRSEIPPDILHDCLRVCLESLKTFASPSTVINVLTSLSECNRFKLAVAFMSDQEKTVCKKLFECLRSTDSAANEDIEAVTALEKLYVP